MLIFFLASVANLKKMAHYNFAVSNLDVGALGGQNMKNCQPNEPFTRFPMLMDPLDNALDIERL